jgi:predicted MPP superfamily phosphohydrolase
MVSGVTWLFVIVDVTGLLLGLYVLRRRWARQPIGGPIVFACGFGAAAAAIAVSVTQSGFGVIRMGCHASACVLAPLAMIHGARLLRRRPVLGALFLAGGLLVDGVYWYARRVEPFDLQVRRYVFETASPHVREPIRIVVVADLQTDRVGAYEERALRRVDEERADLLLFAGDYIQIRSGDAAYEAECARLRALIGGLRHRPRLGAFGVVGDVDHGSAALDGTIVRVREDETVTLAPGLRLTLLSLDASRRPLPADARAALRDPDAFTIVLGHRPDFMASLFTDDAPACLCLAGHTHGGQIVVPGFGALYTHSSLPRRFAGGFHRFGDAAFAISRGIGMERALAPRVRLFCPPELVVVELRPR